MAKSTAKFNNLDYIIKVFIYQILLFFINFLIFTGDLIILSIRYILRLVIILPINQLKKLILKLSRKVKQIFSLVIKPKLPLIDFFKIKYFVIGFLIAFIFILLFIGIGFIKSFPDPKLIGKENFAVSTQILDRKGRLLYEVYGNENRIPIKIDTLPKYVISATIAIEDKDFYKHNGVSIWGGILRALKDSIIKKDLQGGSTITQQLVKASLLTPERTIQRKIKEMIIALQVEKIYSKSQIMEMYLNQVPYGGTAYCF